MFLEPNTRATLFELNQRARKRRKDRKRTYVPEKAKNRKRNVPVNSPLMATM